MSDEQNNEPPNPPMESFTAGSLDAAMDRYMQPIIDTVIRGMLNVMLAVPAKVTLIAVCRVTGFMMANLYAGDTHAVLQFRMEASRAFRTALKSVPPQPLARTQ